MREPRAYSPPCSRLSPWRLAGTLFDGPPGRPSEARGDGSVTYGLGLCLSQPIIIDDLFNPKEVGPSEMLSFDLLSLNVERLRLPAPAFVLTHTHTHTPVSLTCFTSDELAQTSAPLDRFNKI